MNNANTHCIQKPIFLIGSHRSGTTLLADLLSMHSDLTYWPEPKYVWSLGNESVNHDQLSKHYATTEVKLAIRKELEKYLQDKGGDRLLEKTPSNCLKVAFINEIFPDAVFIHIVRDGRSVFKSTEELTRKKITLAVIMRRASQIPLSLWPKYGMNFLSRFNPFHKKARDLWGPKPKGWQEWLETDSNNIILAKQWAETTRCAVEESAEIDQERYLRIKYDDLLQQPRETMRLVFEKASLANDEEIFRYTENHVRPDRLNTWKDAIPKSTLDEIRPILEPVLKDIGYQW